MTLVMDLNLVFLYVIMSMNFFFKMNSNWFNLFLGFWSPPIVNTYSCSKVNPSGFEFINLSGNLYKVFFLYVLI